jgi:hypothetical protein
MVVLVARVVQGRTDCSQPEGHWRVHMRHTLGQEGQRPWIWVLAAEEWRRRGCKGGRVRTWQGPWELQGVEEAKQEQALKLKLTRETMTQRE